jgi:DNA-binding FadR family transcriptional regulator
MYRSDQSDTFTPIGAPRRRYLHVAEQLLQAIADGVYAPGSRIPGDREIAASTQVSRPTVREALLALEIVGVVEVQPGAGVFVSQRPAGQQILDPLALDAPRELIEARAAIEPVVAGLCAARIDAAGISGLRALMEEGAAAMANGAQSLSRLSELGLLFHRSLASACGNRILAEMTCGLVDMERHPLWVLVNQIALRNQETRDMQIQEHASILDAIESGDAARAQAVMAQHLDSTRALLFGADVSAGAGQ